MEDGRWWSGCSVPLRAAQYMMRTLNVSSTTACMLIPAHAAQVRAVLDLLQRQQGLIALVPDIRSLRTLLCCDDFSEEIERHRLWFAWGQEWEVELLRIFEENPGLPTPSQFVRPVAADYSEADSLVAPAQKNFGEVNASRTARISEIIQTGESGVSKSRAGRPCYDVCVIAPSGFRVWDYAGGVLAKVLEHAEGVSIQRFDPDDPASASPLALAQVAANCGAILAANTARADLPEVAHRRTPWITWVTTPRVPNAAGRGDKDALLVADEAWRKSAIDAGWPEDKVGIANWQHGQEYLPMPPITSDSHVAIVADLSSLQPPKQIAEYSSHALLWDAIAEELLKDPFALSHLDAFLDERMRQLQITAERFDRALFIERLIVPAYQQGLAQLLVRQNIPLRCHGRGWEKIEALSECGAGAIENRQEFVDAIGASTSLIHCWPVDHAHPIDACGRPIVRAFGKTREQFLRDVKLAIQGAMALPAKSNHPLTAEAVLRFIQPH